MLHRVKCMQISKLHFGCATLCNRCTLFWTGCAKRRGVYKTPLAQPPAVKWGREGNKGPIHSGSNRGAAKLTRLSCAWDRQLARAPYWPQTPAGDEPAPPSCRTGSEADLHGYQVGAKRTDRTHRTQPDCHLGALARRPPDMPHQAHGTPSANLPEQTPAPSARAEVGRS